MNTNETNKGEPYSGPSGGLKKPSDWLASEDLPPGQDVDVTIEDVLKYRDVKFEAGRALPIVGALKFAGKEKQLILNATNRKKLVKTFSSDTKLWRGQKIALYVDTNVRSPAGGITSGIRIR